MKKRILKVAGILILIAILIVFSSKNTNAVIYSSISGKVIAEDTGKGVAGVSVLALKPDEGKKGRYDAITDEKGVYVLKDLKPGVYKVGFYKEDAPYLFGRPHIEVVLPRGKHVVNVNHVLKLGGSVSGTVYAADGVTPMSRVSVSADVPNYKPEWVSSMRAKVTDSNGKFLLQGLPESDSAIVEVAVFGHARLTKTIKIIKGKVTENVNFTVKWDDITGINGHVKSAVDGKPLNDGDVYLRDNSGEDIGFVRTDETGKYSIVGMPQGIYKVFITFGKYSMEKTNILVQFGKSTTVDFEFDKPSLEILQ